MKLFNSAAPPTCVAVTRIHQNQNGVTQTGTHPMPNQPILLHFDQWAILDIVFSRDSEKLREYFPS
jgi:hypothetical protein